MVCIDIITVIVQIHSRIRLLILLHMKPLGFHDATSPNFIYLPPLARPLNILLTKQSLPFMIPLSFLTHIFQHDSPPGIFIMPVESALRPRLAHTHTHTHTQTRTQLALNQVATPKKKLWQNKEKNGELQGTTGGPCTPSYCTATCARLAAPPEKQFMCGFSALSPGTVSLGLLFL